MHECAQMIDDTEILTKSTHVHSRCVHDNMHKRANISAVYMPNLAHMCLGMYKNCCQGSWYKIYNICTCTRA